MGDGSISSGYRALISSRNGKKGRPFPWHIDAAQKLNRFPRGIIFLNELPWLFNFANRLQCITT